MQESAVPLVEISCRINLQVGPVGGTGRLGRELLNIKYDPGYDIFLPILGSRQFIYFTSNIAELKLVSPFYTIINPRRHRGVDVPSGFPRITRERIGRSSRNLVYPRFLQIRLGNESCDQISASPNRPKRAKSRDKTAGSLFTRAYTLVEFSQTKRRFFSFL